MPLDLDKSKPLQHKSILDKLNYEIPLKPKRIKSKSNFKIIKGYSQMTDFLNNKIYVRFPNLHKDLQSLNSLYGFSLMKLAKSGLQRTPSIYDEYDLWNNLVKMYGINNLIYLKSDTRKKYILNDSIILSYAMSKATDPELKEDLKLMYNCVKLRENIKELEELLSATVDNNLPKTISPTAYIKQGHIVYRPKYDLTSHLLLSLKEGESVKILPATKPYYNYLTKKLGSTLDSKDVDNWTFLEGYSREEESTYLESILKGDIKATSTVGRLIQTQYFKKQTIYGMDFMFIDTLDERRDTLDKLYTELDKHNLEVKGLTDFAVFFALKQEPVTPKSEQQKFIGITGSDNGNNELKAPRRKRVKHRVRVLTGFYVYDMDNKEFLPVINQVLGYSGEFSREEQYEGQLSYTLINQDYEYEDFYRVEDDYALYLEEIPTYDYKGFNSEVISTLKTAGQLKTSIASLQRTETEKFEMQVQKYWGDANKYETGRFNTNDNKSKPQV